jgi:hypothetical protein
MNTLDNTPLKLLAQIKPHLYPVLVLDPYASLQQPLPQEGVAGLMRQLYLQLV